MNARRAPRSLTPPARPALSVVLLAAVALLAGCGGTTPAPTATAPAPQTIGPGPGAPVTPSASPEPAAAGCTGPGDAPPAGAATVRTIDLDGDGTPDTLWIASDGSTRTLGMTTTAGATATVPIDLAGPAGTTAFALHPDPAGPVEVLLSDNRVADLLLVRDCALVAATDAKGAPWRFDQGFAGQGTGVGCLDLEGDGVLDLVGLNLVDDVVRRTAIDVTGTVAAAGVSDEVTLAPGDEAARETAQSLTCGDRTAAADGVHEPGA
jgi:hypothetical protein